MMDKQKLAELKNRRDASENSLELLQSEMDGVLEQLVIIREKTRMHQQNIREIDDQMRDMATEVKLVTEQESDKLREIADDIKKELGYE